MAKKTVAAKTGGKAATGKTAAKAKPPHVLIVEARYYDAIADELLRGAKAVLDEVGATHEVVTVPGALEVSPAIAMALDAPRTKGKFDGVVALGCVIQGETYHFDIVSNESARGLTDLSIARALPIGNGILTVDNEGQARARLGGLHGHKGEGAAKAALAMIALKRSLGGK
ncbi:6,7-dimethyl-8-ribityllumazine synthase [Pseudolabrys sp. FHR47]|uniref:6,7-dimethyl-8-ribityllumazine synthase n=1 Tax=Pseudolabrys sp. FHR47 TaxID=2562284 RepID=UPI0010BF0A2D|nr:6,7-dimethyl-8-ribityllumazine synthase [Pseudolabrys sp. FHR47]